MARKSRTWKLMAEVQGLSDYWTARAERAIRQTWATINELETLVAAAEAVGR